MNAQGPQTLVEAVQYFADPQICFRYMTALKWPDGKVTCPKCGGERIGIVATRSVFKCNTKSCQKQFSPKLGTIFEDSPLPLSSWFVGVWYIANCKNGVSSLELSRAIPAKTVTGHITQKTAWFILHRIRLAMRTSNFRKFNGAVESDETYVGGRAENMHQRERAKRITGRGGVGKAIVHGLLQRGNADRPSQVRAEVVPIADQDTLGERMAVNVERGATLPYGYGRRDRKAADVPRYRRLRFQVMEDKKPTGGKPMDDLMRGLIQVPKKQLDRQIRAYKARKRKPKK